MWMCSRWCTQQPTCATHSLIKESAPEREQRAPRHVINELCMTDICDNAYLCEKIDVCAFCASRMHHHVGGNVMACVVWCVGLCCAAPATIRNARFCAKTAEMFTALEMLRGGCDAAEGEF